METAGWNRRVTAAWNRRVTGVEPPREPQVLDDGIRLLRQVEWHEKKSGSMQRTDLYRGMRNVQIPERFVNEGGTEFAPMSTTSNLEVAMECSASSSADT